MLSSMCVVRGGQGGRDPSWIFIHGTNIVDRGLKVLFFGPFLLIFGIFSVAPLLENFLLTPLLTSDDS